MLLEEDEKIGSTWEGPEGGRDVTVMLIDGEGWMGFGQCMGRSEKRLRHSRFPLDGVGGLKSILRRGLLLGLILVDEVGG